MESCLPIHWSNSKTPSINPLVIAGEACSAANAHCSYSAGCAFDGTTGVISWTKGGRGKSWIEHWRVGKTCWVSTIFFQEGKLSHETFVGCLVTAFVLWKDGDFWETTSICLKFFCGNVSSLAYLPESKLENLGQGGRTKANLIVEKPRFRYGSGLKKLKALVGMHYSDVKRRVNG